MSKIIIQSKFCQILQEDDKKFLSLLDKHLSYEIEGAKYSPAYKAHRWDGREFLLSKDLKFYSGLLNTVLNFYKLYNKEIELINNIPKYIPNDPIDLSNTLKDLNIEPYDYQLKTVEESLKYDRIIFKQATGCGKSVSAALITAKLNKSTVVLVISKEILYQFHELFSKLFEEEIGIVGDGLCNLQRISIVSIWSVGQALGMKKQEILNSDDNDEEDYNENDKDKIIDYIKIAKIFHLDECHIAAAKTIKNIYKIINPEKIFGWSGTPTRSDGSNLVITGILGDYINEVSASELIRRGILAKPIIKFIKIDGHFNYKTPYPTVYTEHIVNNTKRNNIILSEAKKLLAKNYQVLILFKTINHGKLLYKLFQDNGIETEFLSGKDKASVRKEVKENLLSHKSNCLLASMVFDIGVDVQTLSALILAGAGKSQVKTLQRIGRVIRKGNFAKEKDFVAVVDFEDQVKYLKDHSAIRKEIYQTQEEFVIKIQETDKKDKSK